MFSEVFAVDSIFIHETWWSCGDLHPGLTVVERAFYILIPPIVLYASSAGERAIDACRPQNTHLRTR